MKNKLSFVSSFFLAIILLSNMIIIHAQEMTPPVTLQMHIKYDLAFPGMLPDSPLYKLKVLRDKIIASSIFAPLKKIEFYLMQTDKGILATAMLIDKNKVDLATETALKAENNFTLIAPQLYMLPKKPNKEFFKNLQTAGLKHQEVLMSLIARTPKEKQEVFKTVIEFSKRNLETIESYQIQE